MKSFGEKIYLILILELPQNGQNSKLPKT